jgi:hypothetical protein
MIHETHDSEQSALKRTKNDTILVDLSRATRSDLNKCLRSGICEIKTTDSNGEEKETYCTLKQFHMENNKANDWVDHDYEKNILVAWDMNGDEWRGGKWIQVSIDKITHFEQLTGIVRT